MGDVFRQMTGAFRRSLGKGERLFSRGDAPWGMFVLESGRMRLCRFAADGSEMTVARVEEGQTFAEASLFSSVYHCDAFAELDSQIIVFPHEIVLKRLESDAVFAKALVKRLASQLQESRAKAEIRAIRKAEERIMTALELRAGNGSCVELMGNLKQFAMEIGLTHEVLYRTLAVLERKRRIRREGSLIRIELNPR